MTGFTLLIERTQKSELHFESCMVDQGGTEMEGRLVGCIHVAVQACIRQLSDNYESGIPVSHDDVSQRAAEVFRKHLEDYIRSKGSRN